MSQAVHAIHAVLAGVWLGGVVFTTFVVSPALGAMKWDEPERVAVRAVIGSRYARVGSVNLVLLLVFAVFDGLLSGFGPLLYAELALLAVVFALVATHGAYFGRKLAELAEAQRESRDSEAAGAYAEKRRALQKASLRVSRLNLLVSVAVAAISINA